MSLHLQNAPELDAAQGNSLYEYRLRHRDLEEERARNPTIHTAMTMWEVGELTFSGAMMLCVVCLSRQNRQLLEDLVFANARRCPNPSLHVGSKEESNV